VYIFNVHFGGGRGRMVEQCAVQDKVLAVYPVTLLSFNQLQLPNSFSHGGMSAR
jgi:hypothetical protein